MPRETETLSLMMIGGKQIGGQRPGGRNQDGHGMTKCEDFFQSKVFAPTYWQLLCVLSHAHVSGLPAVLTWPLVSLRLRTV